MNRDLLNLLCDPETREPFTLRDEVLDGSGLIVEGQLETASGRRYPIRNGIPRFVPPALSPTVESFGNEWNHFNFIDFKRNWLSHTVKNTFGSAEAFRNKIVVDAGGGSGAQSLWMLQAGARHVITLELSHAVEDVIRRNLEPSGYRNYDVIQCSIDAPPLKLRSIDGIVYCHNVIQHTPSVERTAKALFDLVAPGGEFVFNCYPVNDQGLVRWVRWHMVYRPLRAALSRAPFRVILGYSKTVGVLRQVPILGWMLEKGGFCHRGDVPHGPDESRWSYIGRSYRQTALNTFDYFGAHAFQHHKSDAEIRSLVRELQPDPARVSNMDKYFARPPLDGCALRVFR